MAAKLWYNFSVGETMTIYKEYKIDNYRQAIDKIKEGILFSEITMPKDEFYKL